MAVRPIGVECTDCIIITGFTPPCKPFSPGGNTTDIYIISTCQIESVTDAGDDGIISDITLEMGAFWHLVKAVPDTVTVTEELNVANGSKNYNLTFNIAAVADGAGVVLGSNLARDFAEEATNIYEKYTIVVETNYGVRFIYGDNRVGLKPAEGTQYASNGTDQELAGFTFVYTGSGPYARPLDDALVLTTSP